MEIKHRIHSPMVGSVKKGKGKEDKNRGEASGAARAGVMGVVANEKAVARNAR